MKAHALRTLLLSLVFPGAVRAQGSGDAKALEAQFRTLISARWDAALRADTAAYRGMVARGAQWVYGDGSRVQANEHISGMAKLRSDQGKRDITDLHVNVDGAAASVGYRTTEHHMAGRRDFLEHYQLIDTYVRHNDRWILLSTSVTPQLDLTWQKPAVVDSATLQEYVGEYGGRWPGYVDVITRKGMQLYVQSTGEKEATPIYGATPDVFYLKGDAIYLIFGRGRDGRLASLGYNWPDGQWGVSRKVR